MSTPVTAAQVYSITVTTTPRCVDYLILNAGKKFPPVKSVKIYNLSAATSLRVGGSDVDATHKLLIGRHANDHAESVTFEGIGIGKVIYLSVAAATLDVDISVVG